MESQLARFERLIIALEQLSARASVQLEHQNVQAADDCLSRADDLLKDLAPLSAQLRQGGLLPPPFLNRARGLLQTHERIRNVITKHLDCLKSEIEQSKAASSRLRQISPAYGAYGTTRLVASTRQLESKG